MLNFSDTVWVFKSSSLPARDGARESSNGEAKGPLESCVASELQLVRREDMPEGDSSRYGRVRSFLGGSSISADSAIPEFAYIGMVGERRAGPGAVPGRIGCVRERAELVRAVLGRTAGGALSSVRGSWVPELRRMCGGAFPLGDSGGDMVSECAERAWKQN